MTRRVQDALSLNRFRWPGGAEAKAGQGHRGAGAGERPVQAAVVVPSLQARGKHHGRNQHDGGTRAQDPGRGGRGAAVIGVVDEADH